MKLTLVWLIVIFTAAFSLTASSEMGHADQPQTLSPEPDSEEKTKKARWSFEADPKLPNVLILGDSISIGYTLKVREQLKGEANVYRPTSKDETRPENCSGTTKGIRQIDRWLAMQGNWDVIHFNWGLHDLKHIHPTSGQNSNSFEDPRQAEPAAYRKNLEEIVKKLKATEAKLIFASTTPYPEGCKPARSPADVDLYNGIATEIMSAHDIQINDLNALVKNRLGELQQKVNVHFNKAGNEALSRQVASVISIALDDDQPENEPQPSDATPELPRN